MPWLCSSRCWRPYKKTSHLSISKLSSPSVVAVLEEDPELSIVTHVQQKKRRTQIQQNATRRSKSVSSICSMSSSLDLSAYFFLFTLRPCNVESQSWMQRFYKYSLFSKCQLKFQKCHCLGCLEIIGSVQKGPFTLF